MKQVLTIPGRLPGLNEITRADRGTQKGYIVGNNLKRDSMHIVCLYAKQQRLKPFKKQIDLTFHWHCANRMRDKDNILGGGIKIILDALQQAGIIKNDGWKEIGDINNKFSIDKENERIVVEMVEVEERLQKTLK